MSNFEDVENLADAADIAARMAKAWQSSTRSYHEHVARTLRSQAASIAELSGLLEEAIEATGEPDCWYDHNGNCQAHNLEPRGECWVERARAAIARDRAPQDAAHD